MYKLNDDILWPCPKVLFRKYKKHVIHLVTSFYKLVCYKNNSNIKNHTKEMILIAILNYFLLFSTTSIFDIKASLLNWSHVLQRTQNMWIWSLLYDNTNIFWKILASSLFCVRDSQSNVRAMFLEQSNEDGTPFCLKSVRKSCIRSYSHFHYILILSETDL